MAMYQLVIGSLLTEHQGGFRGETTNPFKLFMEVLENTNDVYVIIVAGAQDSFWKNLSEKYDTKRFIVFEMDQPVLNPSHPDQGRRLRLVILKGTGNESADQVRV